MRLSRVFIDSPLEPNATLDLPKDTAHYLSNVLRLRTQAELLVFNSRDGEFRARICEASKKSVTVELIERVRAPQEASLSIHLLLGLSRSDRMDLAVQKSTELGVTAITPVYTEHGEVRLKAERSEKKLQHWRKIAISACEQSGRLDVPAIHAPCALYDVAPEGTTNRWMLEPSGEDVFPESIANQHIELLIGPEGGFSGAEIDWARSEGFKVVALGQRILRTETAPIAALAILQHRFGDM